MAPIAYKPSMPKVIKLSHIGAIPLSPTYLLLAFASNVYIDIHSIFLCGINLSLYTSLYSAPLQKQIYPRCNLSARLCT